MSKPDDRVVAWALTIERTGCLAWFAAPCTVFPNRKFAECGAEKASEPVAVIPLVPLSLLAEAESRAQHWKGERQAGNAVINDLRARLDAVLSVVTALERVPRGKYPRAAKIIVDLRSAALGGESPANDEVVR